MATKDIIEIGAGLAALLGIGGLLVLRIQAGKAIGARAIQFAVAVLLIPTILILGLERLITEATLGALLGGIAGYALGRVGEFEPRQGKD